MSASAKTTLAFFPPSSSESFLNCGPATRAIWAPVFVPPVNDTALTPGCATIAAPALGPSPCTTLSTPAGNPASAHNSHNRYAVIGVSSLGLATAVFPVAIAGAIFQVKRYSGRFHGEISPATPRG